MSCATVDYERLAWLIDSLGITPDRLEAAVHEIIRTQDRDGLARLTTVEHRLLYYALGEGLVDLRREQDSALRAVGFAVTTFRNDASAYRRCFVRAGRVTNVLLFVVIVLQLLGLGAAGFFLYGALSSRLEAAPQNIMGSASSPAPSGTAEG